MNTKSKISLCIITVLISMTNAFGKGYEIKNPSFGSIEIDIPEHATAEEKGQNANALHYAFSDGKSTMLTTIIFGAPKKITEEKLKSTVRGTGQNMLDSAVENEIHLSSLKLEDGLAYYFSLTDKAPKPGEYKYVSQGLASLDEILISFTVLHNDESMKKKSSWIESIKSMKHACLKSSAGHFDKLKLASGDIENVATFSEELHLYSMQTTILYNNPETYSGIMPKCIAKEYQSVSDGNNEGSILYFRFDSNIEGKAIGFLTGLLYGESEKPSRDHPEIIEVKNDKMIIYSFPYKNSLSEIVQKLVTPRL
jgi:hypothetical protein